MKYEKTEAYRKYQREWHKADRAKKKAANDPLYFERLENGRKYHQENKERLAEYRRQYREINKEKLLQGKRKYYEENKEKCLKLSNARFQKNKEKIQAARRERYKNDVQFRLAYLIRNRLRMAISRGYKAGTRGGSSIKNLGCTIPELQDYIAAKFERGMSWENHGQWHLDHIIPLDSFDLLDDEQYKRACHYTNLQPLWAKENIAKRNKIIPPKLQPEAA